MKLEEGFNSILEDWGFWLGGNNHIAHFCNERSHVVDGEGKCMRCKASVPVYVADVALF